MHISPEGKIAILLGLLALAGGGAVWVAPDRTEIGWGMIAVAILGLIALCFYHAWEGGWIGKRFMPIALMVAGTILFFTGAIWLGIRTLPGSIAPITKSPLDRNVLIECQFAMLPEVLPVGPFYLIQFVGGDYDGGYGTFGREPGAKLNWEGMGTTHGEVCKYTNYGASTVLNIESVIHVEYSEVEKHENGTTTPGRIVKSRDLIMPKFNLPSGATGQIFFVNRSIYYVRGQLPTEVRVQQIGSEENHTIRLIPPSVPFGANFSLTPFVPPAAITNPPIVNPPIQEHANTPEKK